MTDSDHPVVRYVDLPRTEHIGEEFTDEEKAILQTVNRRVAAGNSIHEVIDFLFESTRSICSCDRLGTAFVEENGVRVTAHDVVAAYEPVLLKKPYSEDLKGSSLRQVIERGTPRIINDLEQYLRENPNSISTRLIVKEGIRSSMTCPLTVDGRQAGLLFRSARQPNAYRDRDVRMHQAIAERLSQAVEKAHRIEQLESANKSYSEMLGFVSHELKSPVASIVTNAKVMLDGYVGDLTPKQREMIEPMVRKGEYLLGLIREYLDLARVEGHQVRFQPSIVNDFQQIVLEPAIEIVLPQIKQKRMALVRDIPDGPLEVTGDPNLLKIVLVNLLDNAAKYGRDEGEIRIQFQRESDAVRISIWNEGLGFSMSERAKLFRKFSRIQRPDLMQQKGTGVGLYSCWKIIQLHGGRITADSEEGHWAEFSFWIPQPLPV
ncbi:MAG: GAF domain-containing sensor histidine kinase [Pirellulales bacterium]|nr:GAF domain-containing sensor histidine kinase [Pirellulales bacterium]